MFERKRRRRKNSPVLFRNVQAEALSRSIEGSRREEVARRARCALYYSAILPGRRCALPWTLQPRCRPRGHQPPSASPNVRRLIRSGKGVPAPSRNPTQPIVRRWTCVQKRRGVPCPFIFRNLFFPGQRSPLERARGEPPSSPSTPMATVCRWSAPRRVPPWTP